MLEIDYKKYPYCGYEHRWLPGIGYWVSTGPVRCKFAAYQDFVKVLLVKIEKIEDVVVGFKATPGVEFLTGVRDG